MFSANPLLRRHASLLALAFLLPLKLFAAGQTVPGAALYKEHCARCHGKNGEGVKNKYADALFGDWSLEKLTRYIDRNMPEDDPDKCDAAQSAAVAQYIYEAFYSREARARNHPARIELVRLTNRQFANTVADLLRSFSTAEGPLSSARGLKANYRRSAGGKEGEQKNLERVDAGVEFNFAEDTSVFGHLTTNGFGANWRGSVLAEESGEYEFKVRSPNGIRLWVNDEDKPLIDASVASGDMTEHRASLRLLGGRAYPVRLEFNKAPKDKAAAVALLWKRPHGAEEVIPARRLHPSRVAPTFVLTTPFPADDSSVGYERGVSISKEWDEAATHAAFETANYVAKNLDRLARTKVGETNRAAKLQTFCEEFVSAAFRRPLTAEQKKVFVTAQLKTAPKLEDGVKRVVLLALKSPRFLYLGLDRNQPDDYEVAARLSYGLWDSMPDAALLRRAGQGQLRRSESVASEARRLLADPRAHAKVLSFLHHWLQIGHVDSLAKDDKLFPGFTPEIISDLRTSLNLFLDDVVWSESSDYRRLLLEDDLFLNRRLAEFYGLSTNRTDEFVRVSLDPKERSGVVTHPYLLAAFSYQKTSSPIHRGVFLTRNIVGRMLRPPPVAVAFKDADFKPDMTMREKVEELTRPQACQGCHAVINPLGFSLEHYDAVGRYRTRENGRTIDAASEYVTDDGTAVKLRGARDVAEFAVASEPAQNAFVEQLFHQIVKQPMLAYGPQVQAQLRQSFAASGYNIQKLMVDILQVAALHGLEKPAARNR